MNVFPVFERELRVRARRPATYWTRSVTASLGIIACLPLLGLIGGEDPSYLARFAFNCMVTGAFLLCCVACLLTADLVSGERRDNTLGLLFLTPLKAFEILLGKLGSVGLSAASGLLAFLPLLMVPILAGAVTAHEVILSALALIDLLFLSLATGLWVSVHGRDSIATGRKALLLLAFFILAPAIPEGLVRAGDGFSSFIGLFSPLVTITYASDTGNASVIRYSLSLAMVQALGWLLLAGANIQLRSSLSNDAATQNFVSQVSPIAPRHRPIIRQTNGPGDSDPIEWAVRHQRGLARTCRSIGTFLFGYYLLLLVCHLIMGYPLPGYLGLILQPVFLAISMIVTGLLARGAGRFLSDARHSGQLEPLLTTPLGAKSILIGQRRALVQLLRWPIGLPILLGTVVELFTLARAPAADPFSFWTFFAPITATVEIAKEIVGLFAICSLGMWFGLKGDTPLAIMAKTAGLTSGIPFLFRTVVGFSLSMPIHRAFGSARDIWLLVAWFIIIADGLYYLWLIIRTRRRLLQSLSGIDLARTRRRCFCFGKSRQVASSIA